MWRIRKTWVLFDSGELKTYCCQFETFAKLGAHREGGWRVRKVSISSANLIN